MTKAVRVPGEVDESQALTPEAMKAIVDRAYGDDFTVITLKAAADEFYFRYKAARILYACFCSAKDTWQLAETRVDGQAWVNPARRLYVIASVEKHTDGNFWLHLSMSHAKRIPNYQEMQLLKRLWAGREAKAVEVHPPEAEHVNICERARHLWVCLSAEPLPDFTRGNGSI